MSDIAFLAGILLLFAGVEVHAVHAPELKNPQTQFPRAMFLAALISFGLFTLGALAVADHHALRPDQPPVGTLHHVPDRLRTLPRRMAHQRHEPARGVRRIGGRAVVDLGPQPRPALDGQRRAAAAPVAEDQPQRRADQHPHHPGLHRDGAFVALHLHEGRERRLLPAERPHDRTVPDRCI